MYNQALAAARSSPLVAAAAPSAAASQAEALPAEAHPGRAGFAFGEGGVRAHILSPREQAPRWSTLEEGGQLRRERELQMLLSLAQLSEAREGTCRTLLSPATPSRLPRPTPRYTTIPGSLRSHRHDEFTTCLQTPSCLEALLSAGASVETLRSSSIEGVHAIARRAGLPVGQRARLTNAVRSHLHREPAAPQDRQETKNGDRLELRDV